MYLHSQGLWCDRVSSLWMLPCMTDDLVSSLYRRDIKNVPQLLDVPFATLQALCGNSAASRLKQVMFFCLYLHLLSIYYL